MSSNCIFCAICAGETPAFKVYEDDIFLVIMDRFPTTQGHILILPKRHSPDIFSLTDAEVAALMPLTKRLAEKIKTELNPAGLNLLQNNGKAAGQEIFHFHIHLIPRYKGDGFKFSHIHNDPPLTELEEMAKRLCIEKQEGF